MKHLYLLCLLLPLLPAVAFAQAPFELEKVESFNTIPVFKKDYLMVHDIQSVRINTIQESKPGVQVLKSTLVREISPAGSVQREVEMVSPSATANPDTSRISNFIYNEDGILGWKQETDVRWGKVFRTGYRFIDEDKVYQERDFEMLANEQVMLLETKQYLYEQHASGASVLAEIRFREGRELTKSHHFDYDKSGLVIREVQKNGLGEIVETTEYARFDNGSISEIVRTNAEGFSTRFTYTYNEAGLPSRVEWNDSEEKKGLYSFEYDQEGLLLAMENVADGQSTIRRSFQYEKTQPSASVNLAER